MTYTFCKCKGVEDFENFPDMRWTINGTNVYYPKETYLHPRMYNGQCALYVTEMYSVGSGDWMMGINFWENYYMVMDNDNMRIGMAPSKVASKRVIAAYSKKDETTELNSLFGEPKVDHSAPTKIDAIIWGVFIVIGIYTIYEFINNCLKSRKRQA